MEVVSSLTSTTDVPKDVPKNNERGRFDKGWKGRRIPSLAGPFFFLSALCPCAGQVEAGESQRPASPGGVYDKPYIRESGSGTDIGGYIDHELI